MDASKAIKALTDGDLVALIEALDVDRSIRLVMDGKECAARYRIGRVQISRDLDVHGNGTHAELKLHVYGTAMEADEAFNDTVRDAQNQRGGALSAGLDVGQLYVDGVLTPAPVLSAYEMFQIMLDQHLGRHRAVEAAPEPVTVPDTVPDGWV